MGSKSSRPERATLRTPWLSFRSRRTVATKLTSLSKQSFSSAMARLAVLASVIFSLFILSHSRSPFDLPEDVVPQNIPSNTFPVSATESHIFLPTSEPANTAVVKQKESDATISVPIKELPQSDVGIIEGIGTTKPYTVTYDISFRPINRHFHHHMHPKGAFPFRFPHRCRHRFNPDAQRHTAREISYGNDMIMSDQKLNSDPMIPGDVRGIPARWVGFPRETRRIPIRRFDSLTKEEVKASSRHNERNDGDEEQDREEEREEGGFLKRFRKFLNRF